VLHPRLGLKLARIVVDNGLGDIPARQGALNQKHSGYQCCGFCMSMRPFCMLPDLNRLSLRQGLRGTFEQDEVL
jgi:hypothetical protein